MWGARPARCQARPPETSRLEFNVVVKVLFQTGWLLPVTLDGWTGGWTEGARVGTEGRRAGPTKPCEIVLTCAIGPWPGNGGALNIKTDPHLSESVGCGSELNI